MILLVNQHTVPLFVDVANAFADQSHDTRLFAGHIERGGTPLSAKVKKIASVRYNRSSSISRFSTWMLFSIHYFFYLLFCKKPTHVVVVTNPPVTPFITAMVAGLRGIPFHVVVFDLYPEALQQAGLSSKKNWIFKLWQRNNRWTFKKANGLITLSESMKSAVAQYADPNKIHIVFNWADVNYIRPVERKSNPFTNAHGLGDKLVVLYAGNMGLTHDLESVVEAAAKLREHHDIFFVMIGEGGKRKKLDSLRAQHHLTNILFLPYQDATMFPFAMAAADIGIVTLGTGAEGISVPSKTYVNMAAGLAIIAISPANSELDRIIDHYGIGYAVLPDEAEKIAQHIVDLAANPSRLSEFKHRSREASLHFTPANARQYIDHVTGVRS